MTWPVDMTWKLGRFVATRRVSWWCSRGGCSCAQPRTSHGCICHFFHGCQVELPMCGVSRRCAPASRLCYVNVLLFSLLSTWGNLGPARWHRRGQPFTQFLSVAFQFTEARSSLGLPSLLGYCGVKAISAVLSQWWVSDSTMLVMWLLKHGALPPHLVAGCSAGSKAGGIIPDTQSPDPKNLNL
jgi:hypothetical protein